MAFPLLPPGPTPTAARADATGPRGSRASAVAVGLCAAITIALACTPVSDYDVWQHLRVGQVLWRLHELPRVNVWTWPTLGAPYDIPSWLFRVMLWPMWAAFGPAGLTLWRVLTAVALAAMLFVAARRAARERFDATVALAAIAWGAVLWHTRWQCRPETVVAPLFAAVIAVLEHHRGRDAIPAVHRDPLWLLAPLQLAWINVHLSYFLGLAAVLAYGLDAAWCAVRGRGSWAGVARLAVAGALSAVACLANPFGMRAVWQPFGFVLHERHELIYRVIDELRPLDWAEATRTGFACYLALAIGLAIVRWRRRGVDVAQAALLAALLPQVISTRRFVLLFTVATLPLFVRDAGDAFGALLRNARARLAAFAPACLFAAIALVTTRPALGVLVDQDRLPVGACDFMGAHDVRGRGYNLFFHGGYLLWRFWPEQGRLPFMDIHQTGATVDRDLEILSQSDTTAWAALDRRWRFDWVLLPTHQSPDHHLLDTVDADTTRWALVFADDAASLFVRRDGRDSGVAATYGYRLLRLGHASGERLEQLARSRPDLRAPLAREMDRSIAASPWHERVRAWRGAVAAMDRDDAYRAAGDDPRRPRIERAR